MKNYLWLALSFLLFMAFSCKSKQPLTDEKRTALQTHLLEMVTIDQIAAKVKTGKYSAYTNEEWDAFKDSVFQHNQKIIEDYFRRFGYLGYQQVGKESSNHFWLMVQHSDHDPAFQRRVLRAMKKQVKKKNANPENYAYLFDRVQVNAGKKQVFGTQLTYLVKTTGRAIPKIGLIDSANVDRLRKEHLLPPLKEYLNAMTELHFQMNKDNYIEKGVTAPDLH
ncbi:hypothetical protein PQ465_00255 [Sphingobacterium oryzagri]|uniref:Uncharacterized protein n=1 Tax=Sphingobacterium oryzagri TaxID=3025669 RepID=A0ABY7WK35_9SPHI|nr:DUF6624 domain-containing protein [Sphingobacterium sp. KACC 22765]WDF68831.1 hypothetical protein PQ465_00255 [Sphingobacterium sp. KACC 22765]